MLFSRVVSFFALSMTFGSLAMANPVADKRDATAVENIVTTLKSTADTIIPQIKSLVDNNNATESTVVPLMNQLITAVNRAQVAVAEFPPNSVQKRQDAPTDIGALVADLIATITALLTTLEGATGDIPILGVLIPELVASVTGLVASLAAVVTGLVTTLSALLTTISATLSGLGLGLLISLLGILAGL